MPPPHPQQSPSESAALDVPTQQWVPQGLEKDAEALTAIRKNPPVLAAATLLLSLILAVLMLELGATGNRWTHQGSVVPLQSMAYFEDRTGLQVLDNVYRLPFVPMEDRFRNIGYSDSTFWLRIDTHGLESIRRTPFYLTLDVADVGEAVLWTREHSDGTVTLRAQRIGVQVPANARTPSRFHPAFEVAPLRLADSVVYLQVRSMNSLLLRPRMLTETEYAREWGWRMGFAWMVVGSFAVLLISGAFWWGLSRESQFLWLVVGAFPLATLEIASKNIASDWAVFVHPWLAPRVIPLALALFLLAYLEMSHVLFGSLSSNVSRVFHNTKYLVQVALLVSIGLFSTSTWYLQGVILLHVGYLLATALLWLGWLVVIPSSVWGRFFISGLHFVFFLVVCFKTLESTGASMRGWPFIPTLASILGTLGCLAYCLVSQFLVLNQYIKRQRIAIHQRKRMIESIEKEALAASMALEKAKNLAEARSARIAVRSAELSHELRSPLSAIIGISKLLVEEKHLEGFAKKDVGTIRRLATGLLSLTDTKLAEISAERTLDTPPEKEQPRVIATTQLTDDFRSVSEWMSMHHQNAFVFYTTSSLPSFIEVRENGFRQIFINLVTNAGRYCEDGQVSLELGFREESANVVSHLVLRVADSGQGMDAATLDRIFQRDKQSQTSVGLGMGLAIVKDLVDAAGGTIAVSSQKKKGTSFIVRYPAKRAASTSISGLDLVLPSLGEDLQDLDTVHSPVLNQKDVCSSDLENEIPDLGVLREMAANGQYSDLEMWLASVDKEQKYSDETLFFLSRLEELLARVDFVAINRLLENRR